jgi:hypothetical protein
MNTRLKLSAAIFVAAGTFAVVGAAPANAAACPSGSSNLSTLTPLAFSCTQGQFTFTLNSFSGFTGLDGISFSNPSVNSFTYTFQGNLDWVSGTSRSLNYTILGPTGKLLSTFTNNSTSSDPGAANTWAVVSQTSPQQTGTSTMTSGNGALASSTLTPGLSTETFVGTLDVTAGGVQSVVFRVNAVDAPTTATPGPLPILGAAAAFGFSRKVRNRIKAAA